jgi:hypothetical protein
MTERRRLPRKRAWQNFSFECADHIVLTGIIIEHGKIYLPATKAFICTFSMRANPERRS